MTKLSIDAQAVRETEVTDWQREAETLRRENEKLRVRVYELGLELEDANCDHNWPDIEAEYNRLGLMLKEREARKAAQASLRSVIE